MALQDNGRPGDSLKYLLQALEMCNDSCSKYRLMIIKINIDIAKAYSELTIPDYEKAIDYYTSAREKMIIWSIEDKKVEAVIHNNLGNIYDSQKKYSEALSEFSYA